MISMKKDFLILNDQGVHARPATALVSKANEFKSDITMTLDRVTVDLKSIMGVLSLGISRGSLVTIEAHGPDEIDAISELEKVIKTLNLK